ncbi:MAG: DUF2079 domain-containing protein, partial [Anaerolineales bacterium]|nr:DUF2079 domain-containing protein [Anaerolineales bacterium]
MKNVVCVVNRYWMRWGALLSAAGFVLVVMWMISRQFATFDTRTADLDRFIQATWNTLNGRFLYSTIEERSILSGHFSPIFAFLAPLLWIWQDPRVLSLAQTVGIAVSGLLFYKMVQQKHPAIAPWFTLAYFLNPALHELALLELRRITFAVPFLAMAFYALSIKNRRLLLVGLFFALLCKEDVALLVILIGGYLLLFERDIKWGTGLVIAGISWLLLVLFVINPALDPRVVRAANDLEAYRGLRYFSDWGNSPADIMTTILLQPTLVVQHMFDADGVAALWRVFIPIGLLLPLLAPAVFLPAIPMLGYLLLSSNPAMHQLQDWYMGAVLPVLFAAIGIGLTRRSEKAAGWLTAFLLATTIIGYTQFSYAPFGGKFNPIKYELIQHHARAAEMVALVPEETAVAAT